MKCLIKFSLLNTLHYIYRYWNEETNFWDRYGRHGCSNCGAEYTIKENITTAMCCKKLTCKYNVCNNCYSTTIDLLEADGQQAYARKTRRM